MFITKSRGNLFIFYCLLLFLYVSDEAELYLLLSDEVGSPAREFLHVKDWAEAIVQAARNCDGAEITMAPDR